MNMISSVSQLSCTRYLVFRNLLMNVISMSSVWRLGFLNGLTSGTGADLRLYVWWSPSDKMAPDGGTNSGLLSSWWRPAWRRSRSSWERLPISWQTASTGNIGRDGLTSRGDRLLLLTSILRSGGGRLMAIGWWRLVTSLPEICSQLESLKKFAGRLF